jgi:MFS family permease
MVMSDQTRVVGALGISQTLAWASSYYLPAIIADPIAADLHLPRSWVFAAFSGALLLSAVFGPAVGRAIDMRGGRGVLVLSNFIFATGLTLLAAANGTIGLALAWAVLGLAMALGLYDSAFATLTGLYGREARGAITGVTLMAGFASTVGWPITTLLTDALGWREACLVWAALHMTLGLPLNRFLVPRAPPPTHDHSETHAAGGPVRSIGELVEAGDAIATIDGLPVVAPIGGALRGITRDGVPVERGTKVIEVDPRGQEAIVSGLAERPRRLAEAVLEALG